MLNTYYVFVIETERRSKDKKYFQKRRKHYEFEE
jgi:hypothetical protein